MPSAARAVTGPEPSAAQDDDSAQVQAIEGALRRVRLRLRVQRALSDASVLLLAGLGLLALGLCLVKLGDAAALWPALASAVALPLFGAGVGALRPIPPLLAARLLDRALAQPDLLASAFSFSRVPAAERTPFMRACIGQAAAYARAADARAALPLRAPRALRPAALIASGLVLLAQFEVPVQRPLAALPRPKPKLLHEDDVQAFREELAPILAAPEDPLLRNSAGELNALLEALHEGELDRAQALAALRGIEKRLELAATPEDDAALREALRELGRSLAGETLAKAAAEAFQSGAADAARRELERLAAELERSREHKDALRKLGQALARADKPPTARSTEARAREALDRLLKKKQEQQSSDPREQRLLREKQRELEKLTREQEQRDRAERQLDDLRRELSGAAPPLAGGRNDEAARKLSEAARQLSKAQAQQRSAEQRKQLAERLQQLRELLSKQRQAMAQGDKAEGQEQQPAAGGGKRLDVEQFARAARGEPEAGSQPNEGKPEAGGQLLMPGQGQVGPDGQLLQQQSAQQLSAELELQQASAGNPQPGNGGRPQSAAATREQSTRVDTRVEGAEGKGPSRSEVILEAGQRGFVSRDYEQVHTDYERHAEAVLERDRVPGGYRFYVRRYFQLIRPREGEP